MMKLIGMALLTVGAAAVAFASTSPVPEIDPNSAVSALALVSGALLVLRGRRKS